MNIEHNIEKIQPNIAPFRYDGIPEISEIGDCGGDVINITYKIEYRNNGQLSTTEYDFSDRKNIVVTLKFPEEVGSNHAVDCSRVYNQPKGIK